MSARRASVRAARLRGWWASLDQPVLFAVLLLYGMGMWMALAASPGAASRFSVEDPYYFAMRHGAAACLGAGALLAMSALTPWRVRLAMLAVLAGSFAALALTALIGVEVNGARRWLQLGPARIQPVEFLKPALVVCAAWWLTASQLGPRSGAGMWRLVTSATPGARDGALAAMVLTVLAMAMLAMQPDVGQAVLVGVIIAATAYFAGAPLIWMGAAGGAAVVAGLIAYDRFNHVRTRVDDFIAGGGETSYQADRARAAFAEGGWLGVGPGEAAVTPQLPDAQGDYVLAVAAEEFGAVIVMGIIGLTAFIVVRIILRARMVRDPAAAAAASGLAALIGLQAMINMAVTMNLLPPKGMTLPFVSYGGSSLAASGLAAGAMLALTRLRADVDAPAPEPAGGPRSGLAS